MRARTWQTLALGCSVAVVVCCMLAGVQAEQESEFESLKRSAMVFYDRKDYNSATKLLSQALDKDPDDTETLTLFCDSLRGQGRTANAACQCKKALQETKDYLKAYVVLGHTYHDQGKTLWAKGTLDQAMRQAPVQARRMMKERGLEMYFPERFVAPDPATQPKRKEKFREDRIREIKQANEDKQRREEERVRQQKEAEREERLNKIREMEKEQYQNSGAFTYGQGAADQSGGASGAFGAHPHDINQFASTEGIAQHQQAGSH